MQHDYMTGAELQTIREACNLTREELGTLARVQARSIKHWEQGRMGVPADVAALLLGMEHFAIEQAQALAKAGRAALVRFSRPEDVARHSRQPTPLGLQGAIIAKARAIMLAQDKPCRVVWFRAELYDAWRDGLADSPETLAQWAAAQVPVQSQPFKADQPPKAAA